MWLLSSPDLNVMNFSFYFILEARTFVKPHAKVESLYFFAFIPNTLVIAL